MKISWPFSNDVGGAIDQKRKEPESEYDVEKANYTSELYKDKKEMPSDLKLFNNRLRNEVMKCCGVKENEIINDKKKNPFFMSLFVW